MLIAVALAIRVSIAEAQDCHLALRGTVLEAETNEPLAYATIFIQELQAGTSTDESGHFEFVNLCENTQFTLTVSHIECEHAVRLLKLTENTHLEIKLPHSAHLEEVLITEKAVSAPPMQALIAVSQSDLATAQSQNLAETLRKLPGVTVLNTGATIGKPVIQGLHSNRIAIVTGGTTLESQQWGAEHAPEIDPFSAGKISVLKGAAGVRFGAGAMGGVVIVEPEPFPSETGLSGWVANSFSTNGRGGALAAALQGKKLGSSLAWRLQGTVKRTGNLHSPDYFLWNTGTAELNFSGLIHWKKGKWQHEIYSFRFQQQLGILRASHTGSSTELATAIASPVPLNNRDEFSYQIGRPFQRAEHQLLKMRSTLRLSERWKFSLQPTVQYNRRREYDAYKPTGVIEDRDPKPQITFHLLSSGLDAALEHFPIRHWQGGAGVQLLHQYNIVGRGGFIPDFQTWGTSIWATERWRRYPHPWEWEFGVRYDLRRTHATDNSNPFRPLDQQLSFGNASGTVGVLYHFSKKLTTTLNTGWAWRPPHVNELFARGVHHGTATFEQGRADLQPEMAWNSQFSFDFNGKKLAAQAVIFSNRIINFIYLQPNLTNVLTVRGSFPGYSYRQDDAVLQGFDGTFSFFFLKKWAAEGKISVLRGARTTLDSSATELTKVKDWLPLMPADRFSYALKWQPTPSGNIFLKIGATSTLRQHRIPRAGLPKMAPDAATVWTFEGGHTITLRHRRQLDLGFSAQNLTNLRYREYLNFFRLYTDEIGFNLQIRAKMTF